MMTTINSVAFDCFRSSTIYHTEFVEDIPVDFFSKSRYFTNKFDYFHKTIYEDNFHC
jgi:hypothetical protein